MKQSAPDHWRPDFFTPGQAVHYGEWEGTVVRHYHQGMWEVRLAGGLACVSGADLVTASDRSRVSESGNKR